MDIKGIHYNGINHPTLKRLMKAKLAQFENSGQQVKGNNGVEINSNPATVEISEEGRRLYSNSSIKKEPLKKAGLSQEKELWEIQSIESRSSYRYTQSGNYRPEYLMYLDSPETYARYEDALLRSSEIYSYHEYDDRIVIESTEENIRASEEAWKEASQIESEWYNTRGQFLEQQLARQSPANWRLGNPIEVLEKKYSGGHDLSIGIYCNENQDERARKLNALYAGSGLWSNSTKFNMMITAEMFRKMMGDNEKEKENVLKCIDTAANNMKEIEKNYEGDKEVLRFGVKFRTDGSVTYHANYKGCDDAWGITAESANQLLEKLND